MRSQRNLPAPSDEPEILFRNSVRSGAIGAMWLADPSVAQVVVGASRSGAEERRLYELVAYVVMANHVHILLEPWVELLGIMRCLKGRVARLANRILARTNATEQYRWSSASTDDEKRSSVVLKADHGD